MKDVLTEAIRLKKKSIENDKMLSVYPFIFDLKNESDNLE